MANTDKHDDEALENQEALGSGEIIADQAVTYEGEEGEEELPD